MDRRESTALLPGIAIILGLNIFALLILNYGLVAGAIILFVLLYWTTKYSLIDLCLGRDKAFSTTRTLAIFNASLNLFLMFILIPGFFLISVDSTISAITSTFVVALIMAEVATRIALWSYADKAKEERTPKFKEEDFRNWLVITWLLGLGLVITILFILFYF